MTKPFFSHQLFQSHYDAMRKDIEKTEFIHSVNFALLDSAKDNGSKYLIDFATSSERFSIQSFSVDFATTRRHSGLSTKCIENNLFHRSKLGRDIELQNTLIVFSNQPMMWFQTARLVNSWFSHQNFLSGIETQRLLSNILYCLNCRHERTIHNVSV